MTGGPLAPCTQGGASAGAHPWRKGRAWGHGSANPAATGTGGGVPRSMATVHRSQASRLCTNAAKPDSPVSLRAQAIPAEVHTSTHAGACSAARAWATQREMPGARLARHKTASQQANQRRAGWARASPPRADDCFVNKKGMLRFIYLCFQL